MSLGSRAFDVLQALIERRERIVTKDELLDIAWPGVVVEENNLQVQISTLRKLLGPQSIATIPGRGYRFAAVLDVPPASAAPIAPAAKLRTNLPRPLPALLGRESDVASLGALIDQHLLVSVVGAGGMGKTLLAQHVLDARRETYAHGVCWVEFAHITDPALIPTTVAAALGVDLGVGDPLQGLCTAVGPLDMLIALDNAEHFLGDVAAVAKALLSAAPDVRLLVTTQAPLKLPAEWVYRIGPLAVPNGLLPAAQALDFSAVALFVERARAVDARFVLTDAMAPTVIELCRQLDGLPLAIEFAAARAPMLGVQQLAHSMQNRLKLLNTGRNRNAPARQQTLRAALEWSHGFLDERERTVFRRLAVFAGSASLEAIKRVVPDSKGDLDAWAVMDALSTLVDRSLVAVLSTDDEAAPRYRLLDSPRAYALERLVDAGEMKALRRQHALAIAAYLDAAYDARFSGRIGTDAWFAIVAMDLDNAREALAWAHEASEATIEFQIVAGLLHALPRSLHAERIVLSERCAALIATDMPARIQYRALAGVRRVWFTRHEKRSHDAAQQAVRLARELDVQEPDRFLLYRALSDLVCSPVRLHDVDRGAAALEEAREIEDPAWPPHRLVWRARAESFLAASRGNMDEWLSLNRRVLALDRASGAESSLALCDLVDAELAAGNAAAAASAGAELVSALAGTREELDLAFAQLNLTAALLALGDIVQAHAVAKVGWVLSVRFELQPYWADQLALLAILEMRPRAAAQLAGFADAGYGAREQDRAFNGAAAIQRARALSVTALGEAEFKRLHTEGATLRDEDIAALAFAPNDAP